MSEEPTDFRADRVGSALAGTNPTVLRRMRAGFAVIADVQHLPGRENLCPGLDRRVAEVGPR